MAYTFQLSRGYKDCEKGESSEPENRNVSSSASRQPGMWRLRARDCWLLLVAATVIVSLAGLCGSLSPLHSPLTPRSLHQRSSLLSSSSSSSNNNNINKRRRSIAVRSAEAEAEAQVQPRAAELLNVAAVESVASAGCSTEHNATIGTTKEVKIEDRTYRLYFPVNYQYDKPAPLILSYHGGHRTAKSQEELDLLTTEYFNKDYIVVYPEGLNETWQGVPGVGTDDLGFTTSILDEIERDYCIDTNRIYATGKSQGGGFVGVLACDATLSQRVAAYAPVSGAFYISDYGDTCEPTTVPIEPCSPGRTNIPMLEFHGMADDTIAYMGGARKGGCLASIPHWIQTWAQRDGLAATNVSLGVPGALSGSSAVMYEFGSGWQRGLVTHIMDGTTVGHDWPSTNANDDNAAHNGPATFNASSLILGYFATHPLGWSFDS